MSPIVERIRRDLRGHWQPVLLIGIYILVMNGIFHRSVCPLLGITGLPCPACGLTRAGLLFLHGDFAGAFRMHPFFYGLLALAVLAVIARYFLGRSIGWISYLLAVLAVGLLIYYGYRMGTYFPYAEPMVYEPDSLFGALGIWERVGAGWL